MTDIKSCPKCSKPVVWTFMFSGAEWYCLFCKWRGGMLFAERKPHHWKTKQLKEKIEAEFNRIRKSIIPPTAWMKGCAKCEEGKEYHILHVSSDLRKESEAATKELEDWNGFP